MKLGDKVAVITGGGSGIGKATGLLFSRNGAVSVICDKNAEAARVVVEEIEGQGGKAMAVGRRRTQNLRNCHFRGIIPGRSIADSCVIRLRTLLTRIE